MRLLLFLVRQRNGEPKQSIQSLKKFLHKDGYLRIAPEVYMWYTRKKEVIKMEGKFNIWQKCLEIVCFVLILASSIYKGLFCDGDMGVVITLSFVAILLFIIFSIAALFPATWRMTDREKEKISDLKRYQEKYTSIFVIVNLVLSIFMAWLMLVIG